MPDTTISGKSILITGGLGFIGSNLAVHCAERGARVTVLDACLPWYGWNEYNIESVKDRVELIRGDTRDLDLMRRLVQSKDFIFDCAAQVSHTLSVKNPFLDIDINCRGTMTLLEACREQNRAAKIVFASTRGVIGRLQHSPIDETHPTEPTDMNGIDKLAAEKYYRLYNDLYGIRSCSLRISNTYGPRGQMRSDDYGVVNWFIRRALLDEPIVIHGEGFQTRDYNYVDDVVDAFLLAATSDRSNGQVYMLGSGVSTRFIDVIQMIIETTGTKQQVQKIPRPTERAAIEIGNYEVSIAKIRRELGWQPKVSLREGIEKTVAYYRQHLKHYL